MAERHFVPLNSPFEVELAGTRLLEAGAGTGKTWTIAALVLRLLLERKLEIGQILVVTYTRAASGELRGRVRARLVEALAAFESGTAEEDYLRQLVARHEDGANEAQARLRLAIESFDEAAIYTIHGFCQRALGESAFAAGQPFERELLSDQNEMVAAVARDAWRRLMAEASPVWARWLIDRFAGPDGLAKVVKSHLGRIDARLDAPAAEAAERQAAERAFALAHAEARRIWQADAAKVIDRIAGAQLHKGSFAPEKMQPRIAALEHYLAQETALLPLPEGIDHFGFAKIVAKLNKAGQPPQHPFFASVDALLETAGRLEALFDNAIRRLARDFLLSARAELAERKRRSGQQSYDDLLIDLARALDGPAGPKLAEDLRARYHIALVDEFQDTDPLQLAIFTRVFGKGEDGERPLIFVGDPKQAIYGFRGADVFAYLAGRARADAGYALIENRRSDELLLKAVNALFDRPKPFLLDGLPFDPAKAATMERKLCRIDDGAAPMALWTMRQQDGAKSFTKDAAQAMAAEAVAADIARLLALSAEGRATLGERPLGGGDIAVLVRKHREGVAVRQALARRGIASVSMGGGSVWHSAEAEEIERLLLAIAALSRAGLVRAALATVLLGADAVQLAEWARDEQGWSERLDLFHDDLLLFRERGFMAMWRRLLRRENVVARLLARPDGERRLTNYRHLAELLQVAEHESALDIEGLARHVARQRQSPAAEEHQLRLESDARLVRIVTIHAAKGLQYPVVYCPFLWLGPEKQDKRWPVFAHAEDVACLDFGSARIDALRAAADREEAAEELRLAYVALTRAEHRCVVAWGKVNNCARSPLVWLLFGPRKEMEDAGGDPRARLAAWLDARDAAALEDELHALAAGLPGALAVMPLPTDGVVPPLVQVPPCAAAPRVFAGRIPPPWHVLSFSALAARLAEEAESVDRDAVVSTDAVLPAPTFAPGFSSIHNFPRGTRAGSCLHALFERIDFQGRIPVGPVVDKVLDEFGYAPEWRPVLERMVADVLATPLDAAGLHLAQVARGARLVELEFTFPLGSVAARTGYMKGFIDLVFRHAGRWYIIDWKSNRLDDYSPESLAAAMREHRYDLQLRIYAAALKRALALREPQCDWESSFGGVFYLFLRGMGPGSSNGIHFVRPTATEIDSFLDEAKA
ncbi:MAG: exodeoxyribonuclease V subunit beta [Rhodocyclaceae bacterium]|nr:exodeoxyribonuclease V subunit beta [Rhodocyclaceae bacterium]